MTDPAHPRAVGRPGDGPALGPHLVGQRVVVRRRVPGETAASGRPALTDVIGVLESWADGRLTVRREDGSIAHIPVGDVVAGKPVPPRPERRRSR